MDGQRGQASILIAIIFQILFLFFAMVINVGLLVHDKINLQNSTDIAAYYGAMKQAEILNAMAQLNYQIHQSWKLFNWRLWVLADAGRNADYTASQFPAQPQTDSLGVWTNNSSVIDRPIVCVTNTIWNDVASKKKEDLCNKTTLSLPALVPPNLMGAQALPPFSSLLGVFINQIAQQNSNFVADFSHTGLEDYSMATLFLESFKVAVAERRFAIHKLQNLLISSASDFNDLSGSSVSATVLSTVNYNITGANKFGLQVQFQNGLGGKPFMVPIEVRVFVPYLDYNASKTAGVVATVKQLDQQSAQDTQPPTIFDQTQMFWKSDYDFTNPVSETPDQFSLEGETFDNNSNALHSLIGFEKNPWIIAYVKVTATSTPKMLFSPVSKDSPAAQVVLKAESYAMPFGGKMGPWYYTSWQPVDKASTGTPLEVLQSRTPRLSEPVPKMNSTTDAIPNYSRFPGDTLGLSSRWARWMGINQLSTSTPSFADYQQVGATSSDPVVAKMANAIKDPPSRPAEIAAIAPDLFDATYYSVTYDFPTRYAASTKIYGDICNPGGIGYSCFDLGNDLILAASNQISSIKDIFFSPTSPAATLQKPFWLLTNPEHLNTSWSQGDPGEYDEKQAALSVGKTWSNTGAGGAKPQGGRAGYSVKIVSKHFLQRTDLLLGGVGAGAGPIQNAPQ